MMDIVITEFMDEAAVADLQKRFSVCYDPALVDDPKLREKLQNARAVIVRNRTRVNRALLDAAPALCCVGRLGVGLDNIDVAACKSRHVAVYPAFGSNTDSVAEYVMATAMLLLRRAFGDSAAVAAGDWPRMRLGRGREVGGCMMGLVGFGAIARAVAARANAFGMRVCAHDRFVSPDDPAWAMAESLPLDDLLLQADIVSLHIPLHEETRGLLDERRLSLMKSDAVLINTARGGLVDEDALVARLQSGDLGGAALDVFAHEPIDSQSGACFMNIPNLILTPHIAGVTEDSNIRASRMIADKVAQALRGFGE
ncbi:MAG: hydroxyacid dehydrogenase [Pseudomonadota bacterium]